MHGTTAEEFKPAQHHDHAHCGCPTGTDGKPKSTIITKITTRVVQRPNITVRNHGQRIGRNAPCPCGSGRKYKHCHG